MLKSLRNFPPNYSSTYELEEYSIEICSLNYIKLLLLKFKLPRPDGRSCINIPAFSLKKEKPDTGEKNQLCLW